MLACVDAAASMAVCHMVSTLAVSLGRGTPECRKRHLKRGSTAARSRPLDAQLSLIMLCPTWPAVEERWHGAAVH